MRSTSDLVQLLRDVEQLAPVDQLLVDGVPVWVILRTYAAIRLRQLHPEQMTSSRQPRWFRKWMAERELPAMDMAEDHYNSVKGAEFLTIGYPWQRTEEFNGHPFNPTLDPLHELFEPRKGLHLEVAFSKEKLAEEFFTPTLSLLSRLERARINGPSSRNRWSPEVFRWCHGMVELFDDAYFHTENVANWLDLVLASEQVFAELYSETGAEVIIMDGFGDPVQFGAIRQAHLQGIPAVSIQHRRADSWETSIFDWRHIPDAAYIYLPDVFWHPDEQAVKASERLFSKGMTRHLLAGDPWQQFINREAPKTMPVDEWHALWERTVVRD
jgi:hypothetical protein